MPSSALVAQGSSLYHSLGCSSCHSLDGTAGIGPTWKGLAGSSVQLTRGQTVTADDAYLTKKIENANATTVKGYTAGLMAATIRPGWVSPADVKALVAYIDSLK
jgi:cytochrome c oxidase subunit II